MEAYTLIPSASFYILIDLRKFNVSSIEIVKIIVNNFRVAFTPGIAFGDNMDGHIRMCFATSIENIDIAISSLLEIDSIL